MIKSYIATAAAVMCPLFLDSCYLNTAGHIFDKAKYNALVTTEGIKGNDGQMVYSNGDSYYIKVSRYRFDEPVVTHYSVFDTDKKKEKTLTYKGVSVVQISKGYADYLTGKRSSPKKPDSMVPVSDEVLKGSTTTPIKRTPPKYTSEFKYKSPGAAGYYTLGALDWLCVDLPASCVETGLVASGMVIGLAFVGLAESGNGTGSTFSNYGSPAYGASSSYSGSSGSGRGYVTSSLSDDVRTSDCTRCHGKGYISAMYTDGVVDCPSCNGGQVTTSTRVGRASDGLYRKTCTLCKGQKLYDGKRCPSCLGKGYSESFFR